MNRSQILETGYPEPVRTQGQLLLRIKSVGLYHYLFLITILLLAGTLRFYRLGEWSFWIDEIYSLRGVQSAVASNQIALPISTLLMSASVRSFGVSEWSMRLAPVLIGLASLPMLYLLVHKLFDRQVALVAMLLLAISPWHLYWSQNARFYTTLLLLYLVALITFYWALEWGKLRLLIISLILLLLAIQERLFAAFLIPTVICYLCLLNVLPLEKHSYFTFRRLLLAIAIPLLIFALYDTASLVASGQSKTLSFLVKFIGNPNKSPFRFLASFVYRIGIPTLCLGLAGGLYLILSKKERIGLYLLISALLPPLLLTMAAPFTFTADRYAFVSLPAWIILSAVAIKTFLNQDTRYGQILALAVPFIVVSDAFTQDTLYYTYQNGNRHNWKSAYAFIETHGHESDIVVAARAQIGKYYLGRPVQGINSVDIEAVRQSTRRTWFVVNEEVDPDVQQWIDDHSELIQVLDVYIPGNVYGLRLYLFDPVRTRG